MRVCESCAKEMIPCPCGCGPMPKYTAKGIRSFASKSCELRVRWKDEQYHGEMCEMSQALWDNPEKKARLLEIRAPTLASFWTPERREAHAHLFGASKSKVESGRRTEGEAAIEKALIELGMSYLFEHNIGRYWVDFAIPSHNLIIECDGNFHRLYHDRDAKRDAYLASLGWCVVHFPRDAAIKDSLSLLKPLLKKL